ncbi:Ferroporti-1 [Obelidium mucronatum]|nr:Ferroporti-1 [Obelidium mucronatum]
MSSLVNSYFFTTWATRMDEWAVALMLSLIYPTNLFHMSLYAFSLTVSSIAFGPFVGKWALSFLSKTRLETLKTSIIIQKLAIATSAILLWLLFFYFPSKNIMSESLFDSDSSSLLLLLNSVGFVLVIISGSILRLANRASTIAVEKDWAVVYCLWTQSCQTKLNSELRRVDLFCKLVAPLAVSLIAMAISVPETMIVVSVISLASIPIELSLISKVYNSCPGLQRQDALVIPNSVETPNVPAPLPSTTTTPSSALPPSPPSNLYFKSWRTYISHDIFLASLSLCLLYFSSLSFGNVMITYLISLHYTPAFLAIMRSLSVIAGLIATFTAPILIRNIGLHKTGLVSIWSQVLCLLPVLLSFTITNNPALQSFLFFGGVIFSRLGLWSFDMAQMQLLQQTVVGGELVGIVGGCEFSLQNFFELLSYGVTMVWSQSNEFWISAVGTVCAVFLAAVCFSIFCVAAERTQRSSSSRRRRGEGGVVSGHDEQTPLIA